MNRHEIEDWYRGFQDRFCAALEGFDGAGTFFVEPWERSEGGGGDTRVLASKGPIEKGAVNFSAVWGPTPAELSETGVAGSSEFYATGVSIIIHPLNPYAPTLHANVRYFETDDGVSWFGGGCDLTPVYLFPEDARHFHQTLFEVCERHPVADHSRWKRHCDEYFYLSHRGERRGVGGLFFDHLGERPQEVWALQRDLADSIGSSYLPILERRVGMQFGERELEWQEHRRGRYAEFNLAIDRGTRFGLETGGRTESILASLPPRVRWSYGYQAAQGSAEDDLIRELTGPSHDWI